MTKEVKTETTFKRRGRRCPRSSKLCYAKICYAKIRSKESVNIEESEDCEEDQFSGSQTIKVNKDTERVDKTIENLDYEAGMDHDKDECHVYEYDDQ